VQVNWLISFVGFVACLDVWLGGWMVC